MWYKNIKAQNFLIIFFTLLGIGSSLYIVNLKTTLTDDEAYQIQKTVFSGIFQHIKNHPDEDPDYFFISVSNTEPSSEILNEFRNLKPKVEPASASSTTYGFSASVVHKTDGSKQGIKINVGNPTVMGDGTVKVLASIYQYKGASATYEFLLSKRDGVFEIVSVQFPSKK